MNKITSFIDSNKKRISALALAVSFLSSYASLNSLKNKPVEISKDLATSVYFDNDDYPSKNYYVFDGNFQDGLVNYADKDYVDLSINERNLKLVTNLTIDPTTCDLSDLYMMPNIENLIIYNYEQLSEEDKNIINKLPNLKKIRFNITTSFISKDDKIDLSWLKDDVKAVVNFNISHHANDLSDLYLYYVINNMPAKLKDRFTIDWFDSDRLEVLKKLDAKLVEAVKSFGFDENTKDEDKIIKIIRFVTDTLDYDPQVIAELNDKEALYSDSRVSDYNNKLIETVLNEDQYGICCNYAALSSMLGFYSGIAVDYVTGAFGDSPISGHAWCSYNNNGEDWIIDLTSLDGDFFYNIEKKSYNRTNGYETDDGIELKKEMLDTIFLKPGEEYYSDYHSASMSSYNHATGVKEIPKDIAYENELADKYYDTVMKPKAGLYAALSLTALLLFVAGIRLDLTDPKKRLERANPMKRTRKR